MMHCAYCCVLPYRHHMGHTDMCMQITRGLSFLFSVAMPSFEHHSMRKGQIKAQQTPEKERHLLSGLEVAAKGSRETCTFQGTASELSKFPGF